MNNKEWREQIEKTGSTFELLFRTARRVNDFSLKELTEEVGVPLRPAHTALFPHLSAEGVRVTEIAEKLGISKQAVAKRVDELVEMGTVEKVPDPTDGRARLVRFNMESVQHGLNHLRQLEDECASAIGREKMVALNQTLRELLDYVTRSETA